MNDDEAYMQLVLLNAQSELLPLERGLHALRVTEKGKHNGFNLTTYAKQVGRPLQVIDREVHAAEVAEKSPFGDFSLMDLASYHRQLAEIHAAPPP